MSNFRAKAGTIQLLSKELIVDLPTAVTELWKNGYDAYGDSLSCHLYTRTCPKVSSPVFIVSDDGIGMSREEIEDRWIVIGSTSKKLPANEQRDSNASGKEKRTCLGAKGIGQLSAAYLGSQMLMLTKRIGHPCESLYFDWDVWDNLNLNLGDVDLTIKAVYNEREFDLIFDELKHYFLKNLDTKALRWENYENLNRRIRDNTQNLKLPPFISNEVVSGLTDIHRDHGTKIITLNPAPELMQLAESVTRKEDSSKIADFIRSRLSGLYNLFKYESSPCSINFWIHEGERKIDFISNEIFFGPSDFQNADQLVSGRFDENGAFEGVLRLYNMEKPFCKKYSTVKTACGPFSLTLGYLMNNSAQSGLGGLKYETLDRKVRRFGGIYIYRDNFRILPYGLPENDLFEINRRREIHPDDSFFEAGRFFGYVEITSHDNSQLKDKAGGEGLVRNSAFVDFRKLVISLLIDIENDLFKKPRD